MTTTTTLSSLLKTFYVEDVLHKQFNQQSVLYDRLWKKWETDASGKSYTYAIMTAGLRNAGSGIAEGGNYPAAESVGVSNITVPETELVTPVELSTRVIRAARGAGKGAFISSVRLTVEQAMESSMHSINRQLHSDGRDALAFWTAADDTSGTNVDDGQGNAFVHLQSGATTVDVIDATDNSTELGSDIVITLGAEAAANYAITWTGTVSGSADSDYAVLANTLTRQMMGIRGVVDDANPPLLAGGLHGLTVAAASYWVAQVVGNSGTNRDLTLTLMQRPLTRIATKSDGRASDIKFLLANGPVVDKYIDLLVADKRHVNTLDLDGGQSAVAFNDKPLIIDPQCRRNVIYYINPNSMDVLTSTGGVVWGEYADSGQWNQKPASSGGGYAAAYQARLIFLGNLACKRRNVNGLLEDITD